MQRNKVVILGLVLALALAVSACKSSDSDNNAAAAVVGHKYVLSMGGIAAGDGDGGDGNDLYIYAQAQASALNSGSFTFPAVTMPAGMLVITADTTWTSAMNGDIGDGLYVAPGVTVTVPDASLCGPPGCYGVYGYTFGPVVILGNIVADSANTIPVKFDVFAAQDTAADDNTIEVTGIIDMSGPSNDAGDGVDGGYVYLGNNYFQDTEFGIYISGDIISNGGDATDASATDHGGDGGDIYILGGDNEDILVSGNFVSNGGDAAGDGDGGDGGWIYFENDDDPCCGIPTPDSTGQIALFDLNQINLNGGMGFDYGGDAGNYIDVYSDRSSVTITVPMFAQGADATTTVATDGYGGEGLHNGINVYSNQDDVDVGDLIGNADVIILSRLQANGGDGSYGGGIGGYSYIYAYSGSLYISDIIDFSGGDATGDAVDSYGGNSGNAYFTVYNFDDSSNVGEAYFSAVRGVILDGGNGGEDGGNAGDYYNYNYSTGFIILPPSYISSLPGVGSDTNGDYGYSYIYGPAYALSYFPSLAEFLSY